MENKELIQYLYYYKNTVCQTIDIDDIANIVDYYNEYCNIDFNKWLEDNELIEDFNEYIKGI